MRPGYAPAVATSASRSRVLPTAVALFTVGLIAILTVFVLFATGHRDLPLWLNLVCLLAPAGLAVGVVGAVRQARRR